MDSNDLVTLVVAVAASISMNIEGTRQHNSILTGKLKYKEIIRHENEALFFNHCGMKKPVFKLLLKKLRSLGGLIDSRLLGAGEKLMIFLSVIRGHSYRATATVWQHGYRQISRCVHEVIDSLLRCQHDIWATTDEPILSDHIRNNPKYFPYFDNCLGALDGTHVMAKVPPQLQKRFRGRKGITQNVLGVCNFEMLFIVALTGWEGSAHDARVLNDAVRVRRILPLFKDWFYLGDAGYALTRWCLTPFRGVRYHLKEWNAAAAANVFPVNAKELYNLRHSALRNIIERAYDVVKARFPILRDMPKGYTISTQNQLVLSAFLIHNFIRANQDDEDNLVAEVNNEEAENEVAFEEIEGGINYNEVQA